MPRYYFDIRDNAGLTRDEEGTELPDVKSAEREAALSLAGMARDAVARMRRQHMAIEVRSAEGPLLQAALVFDVTRPSKGRQ